METIGIGLDAQNAITEDVNSPLSEWMDFRSFYVDVVLTLPIKVKIALKEIS